DTTLIEIEVKRAAHADVRLPLRHPLADKLSDEATHCLLHAYGSNRDPYKAGYRNHFYTRRDDPHLVECEILGLVDTSAGWYEGMAFFLLTELGRNVALSLAPEYAP